MDHGRVNPAMPIEAQVVPGPRVGALQPARARPHGDRAPRRRGPARPGRHPPRGDRPLHRPLPEGQARRPPPRHRAPEVWWDANAAMAPSAFERLKADMLAHLAGDATVQVQDLWAGADESLRINVRAVTERAWHALFLRHLLRRPPREAIDALRPRLDDPEPALVPGRPRPPRLPHRDCDRARLGARWVLIGGTDYAGENKKAVFTILNWLLPDQGVLPMHCSANHAPDDPDDAAVFFGLSGTGKTTSLLGPVPRPSRRRRARLVRPGPLQLRGRLLRQDPPPLPQGGTGHPRHHPHVRHRASRTGVLDDARGSTSRTLAPRTPAAPTRSTRSPTPAPPASPAIRHVVMLTCDAFGVLPPIARLTPDQAMYHFLSGFTAKVAGTERGVSEPEPTFSPCFGAPFLPRRPEVYGSLLEETSPGTAPTAGSSTPAGPAAPTAPARGCRSRPPARCSASGPERLAQPDPSSAPIRISALPFQVALPGIERAILDRVRPGATGPPTTARRSGWSACSSTISKVAKAMSTPPSWVLRRARRSPPNRRPASFTGRTSAAAFSCRFRAITAPWPPTNAITISHEAVIHRGQPQENFIRSSGPGGQNVNKVAAARCSYASMPATPPACGAGARAGAQARQRATKEGVIVIEGRALSHASETGRRRTRLTELVAKATEAAATAAQEDAADQGVGRAAAESKAEHSTVKKLRGRVTTTDDASRFQFRSPNAKVEQKNTKETRLMGIFDFVKSISNKLNSAMTTRRPRPRR